jgi:hypothetical protein
MGRLKSRLIKTVNDEAFILLFEEGCIQTPIRLVPIDDWNKIVKATSLISNSDALLTQIRVIVNDTTNYDKIKDIKALLKDMI